MSENQQDHKLEEDESGSASEAESGEKAAPESREVGGPKGPEPTRYGDWERKGIASDF